MSDRTQWWARAATFHMLLAFLVVGPGLVQKGGFHLGWLRSWQMFSGSSVGTCDVRYQAVHPDGSTERLERSELLYDGRSAWRQLPRERAVTEKQIVPVARKLCRLGYADVRATARCAERHGWVRVHRREENLCRAQRK